MPFPMQPDAQPSVLSTAIERAVAVITAAWTGWRNRRDIRQLVEFDDHALRDIGLTRCDLYSALASGPFEDPSRRLVVFAVERRAARLMQWREKRRIARDLRGTPAPQPSRVSGPAVGA
jgi:uncharacterized protein YjiS (DUF1127 family)